MKVLYVTIFLCLFAQPLYAQSDNGMTLEDFLQEAEQDSNLQEQISESVELFDINMDNKISINEVNQAISGIATVPDNIYNDAEKKEMETYFLQAFYESDLNKDNELTDGEGAVLAKAWQTYALKKQFHKMDRNGDGTINEDDIPTIEESTRKLEEAVQRLDEAKNRLESVKPEEIADRWMKNMQTAIADENYYQMDNNHDNCITQAEYVTYHAQNADEKLPDKLMEKVRDMGVIEEYLTIKKALPECLTKDEYITNENRSVEEVLKDKMDKETEKHLAEILFETMDENKDGSLTADEYTKYQTIRDKYIFRNSPELLNQDIFKIYVNEFNSKTQTGKMNKEEFVAFHVEEDKDDGEVNELWFNKTDANQDGCIDMEEYVKSEEGDGKKPLDEMEQLQIKRIYLEFKKSSPNCFTKDDAHNAINQNIDEFMARHHGFHEDIEREYAAEIFTVVDKNADGKISAEEYMAYKKATRDHLIKHLEIDDEQQGEKDRKYFQQKAPQGFMEKEEFIKDYVEIARQVYTMRMEIELKNR